MLGETAEDLAVEAVLTPLALDEHHRSQELELQLAEIGVVLADFALNLLPLAVVAIAAKISAHKLRLLLLFVSGALLEVAHLI